METSNHETRHIFLAIAIILLIGGPFSLAFIPHTILNIRHYEKGDWIVFTPKESMITFGITLLLIFIVCILLFLLDIHKRSIIISMIIVLLSIATLYISSSTYKKLSNEGITFSPIFTFEEKEYKWNEVEKLLQVRKGNVIHEYQMVFKDGVIITLPNDAYFQDIRKPFFYQIRENNISIETVYN